MTGAEKSTERKFRKLGPTLVGTYSVVHGAFLLIHVALVVGFVMVTLCGTGILDAVASAQTPVAGAGKDREGAWNSRFVDNAEIAHPLTYSEHCTIYEYQKF